MYHWPLESRSGRYDDGLPATGSGLWASGRVGRPGADAARSRESEARSPLRSVPDNPTRLDVELDIAQGETRLIAQFLGEGQEPRSVVDVADEPERDPDCAGSLAAARLHQLHELREVHVDTGVHRCPH